MQGKHSALLIGALSALALTVTSAPAHAADGHNLIRAELTPSMPDDPPINGVNPGGLPWILAEGRVRVRENGRMDVRIEGLQIPRNGGADNPVASIDALLYCGGVAVADSGPQPMTVPGGDARFRVFLDVPSMCDDATVLISPSAAVEHPVGAPPLAHAYIASATGSDAD
jgi:hypothetical protein